MIEVLAYFPSLKRKELETFLNVVKNIKKL